MNQIHPIISKKMVRKGLIGIHRHLRFILKPMADRTGFRCLPFYESNPKLAVEAQEVGGT